MSLIFLRVQPIAAAPAGGATPTAGEQQPFIRMFKLSHYRKHNNENNLQQVVQEVKEHRMSLEEAA
jgi:hypothetical protein